eukprot:TRINITY_DN60242_c0_g1_i1.p1 TRINITY_DN60242_c0_g1~~TRINITY_DN60242_c0_g1_i1.p1  ORF type:complete len:331 (+),score=-2.57 TRINITY_DN60242_c0_g1_i1:10-1002(+)
MLPMLRLFLWLGLFCIPVVGKEDVISAFERFIVDYKKEYATNATINMRFRCFYENWHKAKQLNALDMTATYGVNIFSDLCENEYRDLLLDGHYASKGHGFCPNVTVTPSGKLFPSGYDWRHRSPSVVTPVKSQGQCGSGWAFASIAAIETAWALKGHKIVGLSEEELLECAYTPFRDSCVGGYPRYGLEFAIKNHGVDSEAGYPYTSGLGQVGKCDRSKLSSIAAKVQRCVSLPHNEDKMATWLKQNGVISVGVNALYWQQYVGGILSYHCYDHQIDHFVALVGYGEEKNTKYWIIKNTYGPRFGEGGYVRILYGVNCFGVTTEPLGVDM